MGLFDGLKKIPLVGDVIGGYEDLFGMGQSAFGVQKRDKPYTLETNDLIKTLQGQVAGTGPSAAKAEADRLVTDNTANTVAAIRSGGGISRALQNRQAARAMEGQSSKIAKASSTARAQEQLGAQQNLSSLLTGLRGQSLDADNARNQLKNQTTGKLLEGGSKMAGLMG